jgi:hypothetical protein
MRASTVQLTRFNAMVLALAVFAASADGADRTGERWVVVGGVGTARPAGSGRELCFERLRDAGVGHRQ